MSLQTLTGALEKLIEDEIAGKAQLEQALVRQERAIVEALRDELDLATRAIELELGRELDRSRRRVAIFARLGAHWGVAGNALTLGGIVERLGPAGANLERLRGELRASIAAVLRKNRRVARLVHVHSGLVNETVSALLGVASVDQEPGALFEARG
jgi:hypothetical protein